MQRETVHLKLEVTVGLLEVNNELLVAIADDKDTDGTWGSDVGLVDLLGETTLGNNGDSRLDLTAVGDSDQGAVLTSVDDLVLLEGWGHHVVEDNGWGWVSDNAVLLNQLVGEKVNTEVSVLASGRGGGDADDLAWALLEDDQVTDTDVVAWDSEVSADSAGSDSSLWLGGNDLLGDSNVNVREGVSLLGLGVVRLSNVGLGSLNWVEEFINLAAEVLSVVVVTGGVFRHLGGFWGGFLGWLLFLGLFLFFLFLLDDDDGWWTLAVFWGFTGLARSLNGNLLLRESNVYLLNVSWVRDVDARSVLVAREVLRSSGGLGVVGRGFGLDFGLDLRNLDVNVLHVEVVRVVVDGMELLLTWVSANWQRTSGRLGSGMGGVSLTVMSGVTSG
ncbi:hypothetical protein TWF225_009511 [Orbilia oligospora]|uniref:Uncharacterized protein n=1 Tax=Orbilia oligospora TaxID=2813651 RepID=A0A7C8K1X3_ORBOL|nr:hypothetical protein TWF751_011398 [Orbilia oligospora]KAF3174432.1 hypothetical protein TWF225_009511 [Orbilia oligospora]KAF3247749.1 hypothetical protein TWF217_009547 [Orbilia oligospora]KAF3258770.1 hypothetical protein TWF128_004568 [Orbilia oligospora]TGJ66497.1 hypothetical protein EYR41_008124 [Orbilia oligospora]